MDEGWQPIPGFEGYEASTLGRIRSVDRVIGDGRRAGGMVLVATEDYAGYLRVTLRRSGKPVTKLVHQLVCSAFHGPRPRGKEVRHLDGVKVNCRPGNLAWGTKQQQEKDKKRHRRQKLSQVLQIPLGRK
jgi:hypothetical protein